MAVPILGELRKHDERSFSTSTIRFVNYLCNGIRNTENLQKPSADLIQIKYNRTF